MLDAILARHLLLQGGRIVFALFLLAMLAALGARLARRLALVELAPSERLVLHIAIGFAAYQFLVRWLANLPVVSSLGILTIVLLLALAGDWHSLRDDLRALQLPRDWTSIAILLLVLAPFAMALAPAVSRDALIYHLRFPEQTLREGLWAHDPANSSSYYPVAMSTLYLAALAVDAQGIVAQLLHFGLFVLFLVAVAAIARRLGAPSGGWAAVLVAAVPAANAIAGWAWADAPLLFALAASALAILAGSSALAIVLLALAVAVKYSALLTGLMLFVAAVAALVRARQFRALAIAIIFGLLALSPWLVANLIRIGYPLYPLGAPIPAARILATWSAESTRTWLDVWRDYFLRPQTLDEDIGGVLFLVIVVFGLAVAFKRIRLAAIVATAMLLCVLPLTTAMRLILPAVLAPLVVAGAALEQLERNRLAAALVIAFAIRGGAIVAAHDAHFFNPVPAAVGIESEDAYVRRNFAPAALFARADAKLPPNARVLVINEVRLFRFPRPATVSRTLDPPVLHRYLAGANDVPTVVQRLRADGITHILAGLRPIERGAGIALPPNEEQLARALLRESRIVDREGDVALFELP